jgi:hypothetical protein
MNEWVSENLYFNGYPQEKIPDPEAQIFTIQCIVAAKEAGISKTDLENAFGDLPTYMHHQLIRFADAEVKRQAGKDD